MKCLSKKKYLVAQTFSILTAALLGIAATAYADAVNVPNTFSAGTTISSSKVNENFTTLDNSLPRTGSAYSGNNVVLSTSLQNIVSLTLTPRLDGNFILMGVAEVQIDQQRQPGGSVVSVCTTTTSNGSGGGDCGDVMLDTAGGPVGSIGYRISMPITIVNPTGPVVKNTPVTYYMTAQIPSTNVGTCSIQKARLTAIFVPGYLQ